MRMRRSVSAHWVAAGFLVLATGARGQTASIAARVTDAASNVAIDQARLIVVGTTLGGVSDAHGRVLIRGLAPGDYQLRVLRRGYAEQKRAVSIVEGVQMSAAFSLRAVAVSSAPLVTTLTGEIRREEVASAVAAVDAATAVALSPIMTVDDLLTARFAGVTVTPGTQTGAGSRVRIRGASSLHLSNEPIYVSDGVRMTSSIGSSNLFTGGSQPSRVGDLNPEEIESRRFESTNTAIHDWTERPNTLSRTSARANVYASLTPQLDFTVTSNFIKLAQRFSLESNATAGLGSQIFGGPGCRVCSPERVVSVAGTPSRVIARGRPVIRGKSTRGRRSIGTSLWPAAPGALRAGYRIA